MTSNIEASLTSLVVPIDSLIPLPGNPRKGNVEAIMSSYREFGQVKPIVVKPNGDGTSTVISGNHQLEAARRLGWDEIAAVEYDVADDKAVAFALADNRTMEMGHTDPELLNGMLQEVTESFPELWDDLGWDEFELAALDEQATRLGMIAEEDSGYIPPVIVNPDFSVSPEPTIQSPSVDISSGEGRLVPSGDVDHKDIAVSGSTAVGQSGSTKAVVQYTLVFDSPEQQKNWYQFIRWLRADPGYDGSTTAERLMNFLDAHANYR